MKNLAYYLVYLEIFIVVWLAIQMLEFGFCTKINQRENIDKSCQENLNLVMIVIGSENCRRFSTFLKNLWSIHSKSKCQLIDQKINLNLIVDEFSEILLTELIRTWNLKFFARFHFIRENYNSKKLLARFSSGHYSGAVTFNKLILAEIIPINLDKVLWLDSDLILLDDLNNLWGEFESFSESATIGAVPNLSDWYENGNYQYPCPISKSEENGDEHFGINTGVMIIHLDRIRKQNLTDQILETSKHAFELYGAPKLADQDFFNAFFNSSPQYLHILDCGWNVQLGSRGKKKQDCLQKSKILHMNFPKKFESVLDKNLFLQQDKEWLQGVNIFRQKYKFYSKSNGYEISEMNILQMNTNNLGEVGEMAECESRAFVSKSSSDHYCSEMRLETILKRRIHPFFVKYVHDSWATVTLITQFSFDRFESFERLISLWSGPISAVVYATDEEADILQELIYNSPILGSRDNLGIHVVYKRGDFYPINFLRNVAVNLTKTEKVLIIDVDFSPSAGLFEHLNTLKVNRSSCFVLPAFETRNAFLEIPKSISHLKILIDNKEVTTFRQDIWPQGHSATQFQNWFHASSPFKIFWSHDFEPYLFMNKEDIINHKFPEDFVGFGWNKVAFVMGLDANGFDFFVLPNQFILHYPHQASPDMLRYRRNLLYKSCINLVKKEFVDFLICKYGASALKYMKTIDQDLLFSDF